MKMTKDFKENLITYGIVIVAFIIVEIMTATGSISSLMKGLLVPLCVHDCSNIIKSGSWFLR